MHTKLRNMCDTYFRITLDDKYLDDNQDCERATKEDINFQLFFFYKTDKNLLTQYDKENIFLMMTRVIFLFLHCLGAAYSLILK